MVIPEERGGVNIILSEMKSKASIENAIETIQKIKEV